MTFPLIDAVARGAINERWALFTFDMVAPALELVLASDDPEVIADATRLVNVLGERGYEEFGRLLNH